jgi:hypothetical protein
MIDAVAGRGEEAGVKRRTAVVMLAGALVAAVACSSDEEPRPIAVEGRVLWVHNLTPAAWVDVEIWLNTHYRVTRARMPAGERFGIPLDTFVAGYGQRFSPARQVVQRIEVRALTTGGEPVKLVWGDSGSR